MTSIGGVFERSWKIHVVKKNYGWISKFFALEQISFHFIFLSVFEVPLCHPRTCRQSQVRALLWQSWNYVGLPTVYYLRILAIGKQPEKKKKGNVFDVREFCNHSAIQFSHSFGKYWESIMARYSLQASAMSYCVQLVKCWSSVRSRSVWPRWQPAG